MVKIKTYHLFYQLNQDNQDLQYQQIICIISQHNFLYLFILNYL